MKNFIEPIGWVYFVLNNVGVLILVITTGNRDYDGFSFNQTTLIIGVAVFIQSVVMLAICIALGDILENTKEILKKQEIKALPNKTN